METERAQAVRSALVSGDGVAALRLARELGLEGLLQRVGELVLVALAGDAVAAGPFARRCVAALRRRGVPGDQELADSIDAALGVSDGVPALTPLAADLDMLAELLDGGPDSEGGRLDLTTGESWPEYTFDPGLGLLDEDEEDEDEDAPKDDGRWLYVESYGSRYAYRDMVDFAATRSDERLRRRLEFALDGRGAFGRFKDALFDRPEDREEWYDFSEDRRAGRAREWLADAGYRAVPRTGAF
ncbi:MAG: UPF0158 family protein [Jatrophihabitans sp.]|uniref:UPF0158 family protein n=1 Tax=Jatrophihabitans sp. TaxID=1932789 RepID=UPI003F819D59